MRAWARKDLAHARFVTRFGLALELARLQSCSARQRPTMRMPALLFEVPGGIEDMNFPLILAGSPLTAGGVRKLPPEEERARIERFIQDKTYRDEQLGQIRDSVAQVFFQRLAANESMQWELMKFWEDSVVPVERSLWDRFRHAFGDSLRVVHLDVPAASGYEYRYAPGLIAPHVPRFLQDVSARRTPSGQTTDREQVARALYRYFDGFVSQNRDSIRSVTTQDFVLIENGYPMGFERFTALSMHHHPESTASPNRSDGAALAY